MYKITKITKAAQYVTSITRYEWADAERDVTATKETGPAAVITMDVYTLLRPLSSLQSLIEELAGLIFSAFL